MRVLLSSIAVAFVLSLLGKILADALLVIPVSLFGGRIELIHTQNPGIAFGIALPAVLQTVLIIVAVILLLWVALKSKHTTLSATGFGLIIGGALGNILDRSFDGLVTDFIRVGWFPVFNIADSCITIGVCLLLLEGILTAVRERWNGSGSGRV